MEEKILEFEKFFKNNIVWMLEMTVLYHLWCHENYAKLTLKEKAKILDIAFDIYIEDESHTDMGLFADIIMENYEKVLEGKINKYNIYNYI